MKVHNKFIKAFGTLLIAALLFGAMPAGEVKAQTGQDLYVAEWSELSTISGFSGRPMVVHDGTTYHMWYGPSDNELYHTSSTDPSSFSVGTLTTFDFVPYEVSSPAIVYEDGVFYLITYKTGTNLVFSIYTSSNGVNWVYKGDVYDGTGLGTQATDWRKIDAPTLLPDNGTYKLYFQVAPVSGDYKIYIAETGDTTLAAIADDNNDNDFTLANNNSPVLTIGGAGMPDETSVQHPMVVEDGGTYFMWYTGVASGTYYWRSINLATSTDGVTWTKSPGNPVWFDTYSSAEPTTVKVDGAWHLWFEANGDRVDYLSASGPFEFQTIQGAIDAATAGDTIKVYPGIYEEKAVDRQQYGDPGDFTLFIDKELSLIGVDSEGNPILDSSAVKAQIKPADGISPVGFGPTSVFVKADNVSIQGFDIFSLPKTDGTTYNKNIEITGNNFSLTHSVVQGPDGSGSLYFDKSNVQSFNVSDSEILGSLSVNDGAGDTVDKSARIITNNQLYRYLVQGVLDGTNWLNNASGAVTLENNTFFGSGPVIYSVGSILPQPWESYFTDNVFLEGSTVALEDPVSWKIRETGTAPFMVIWTDIQNSILDAIDGDTVLVGPGTYVENVVVDKQVSIIGAGSGVDGTVVTTPAGHDTQVGVFQITGSGVVGSPLLLQDLRVEPVSQAGISVGRFYETTGTNVSYLTLDNVKVVGTNTNPSTEQERGLYVDNTSTLDHLVVTDSAFNNLTYGWYFQKAVSEDTSTVSNVQVTNTTYNHNNHKGIYAEKLSDATFTGITVNGNGFDGSVLPSYFAPWMSGIDINLKAGTYQNISFIDSTITNNALGGAKEGVGITVKARDDATSYNTYPAELDGVIIQGSTVTGNERGIRIGEPGKDNAGPTGVVIEENLIYDNVQAYSGTDGSAYGDLINVSLTQVDASPNYWGKACEPTTIVGDVIYSPWYMDEAMTMPSDEPTTYTFPADATLAQMNEVITCASDYSTLTFEGGTYPGGIVVPEDRYGLTFKLNGAKIGPGSAAFEIYGDAITIEGPGVLDGTGDSDSSPAILVGSGVSNFSVSKLEIFNWVDGVHYAGAITNTQVVDNYFHTLSGDAVHFTQDPTIQIPGISFHIMGNMFLMDTIDGFGVNAPSAQDVTYNSWGSVTGPAAGDLPTAFTATDYTPFTHVDLYMVSTAPNIDTWADQVFVNDTITYQVKANVVNMSTAAFEFTYPTDLLGSPSITNVNSAFYPVPEKTEIVDATTAGVITFDGQAGQYSLTSIDGDIVLFEVTFTALQSGTATLDFNEETDGFGMSPGYGPSLNIYADELVDNDVNIIDRPTLSTDISEKTFIAGLEESFSVTLNNPSTGGEFTSVRVNFTIDDMAVADIVSLAYFDCTTDGSVTNCIWNDDIMLTLVDTATGVEGFFGPPAGFFMGAPYDITTTFLAIFKTPGTFDFTFTLVDMLTDTELATTTGTAVVLGNFDVTGTIAMQGRTVRSGVPLTLTDSDGLAPDYVDNTTTSTSELAYNVLFSGVNGGTYQVTTSQPRYLNVTAELNKQIFVSGAYTIPALELKGGNAVWEGHASSNNKVDIYDASEVGTKYGTGTIADNADVNFDGKVNIQDLALVGGNFDLTSGEAYDTWFYNGDVYGPLATDETGHLTGTLTGDYALDIDGYYIETVGGIDKFTGTVSGDINGSFTIFHSGQGVDPIYGIVTDTGASETVRIVGANTRKDAPGFVGKVITGDELDPVNSISIAGDASVEIGKVLQLDAIIDPETATEEVLWSIYVNDSSKAIIDEETGTFIGLEAGNVTVIVVAIDDSNVSYATKIITVVAP